MRSAFLYGSAAKPSSLLGVSGQRLRGREVEVTLDREAQAAADGREF
jgi:hypothetical protein